LKERAAPGAQAPRFRLGAALVIVGGPDHGHLEPVSSQAKPIGSGHAAATPKAAIDAGSLGGIR
jgi:hypothetical protein